MCCHGKMQLVVGDQFRKLQDALHLRTPMIYLKLRGKRFRERNM
jgi:hypothetical protein